MAPEFLVPLLGFAVACLYGAIVQRTGFCTMGAFADAVSFGDQTRLRMYVVAIVVAILGSQALRLGGLVDLTQSIYAGSRVPWLAHIVGGVLFGIGMSLASGCGARNLVRLGAGNLKSLLVLLVMALAAYATLRGVLAPVRVHVLEQPRLVFQGTSDLPSVVGNAAATWITLSIASGSAWWCLGDREFRSSAGPLLGGAAIGLLVVAGWYVTGHLGFVPEDPETLEALFAGTNTKRPESLTYVAPLAWSLEWITLWSDGSRHITFGIAAVLGAPVGAAVQALATGQFRFELFTSPADVGRHVAGAILMGFGGVTALGCSIGQGITGVSTLAIGSLITLAAITAGSIGTLQMLHWRLMRAA
jgi:hypothetical protein